MRTRLTWLLIWLLLPALGMAAIVSPLKINDARADAEARTVSYRSLTVKVNGVDDTHWTDLSSMLGDQLTLSGNAAASEPLADDLAFFTRQHYISEGWPHATVNWELRKGVIELEVDSGEQVLVGDIKWIGDVLLPQEELRKFLLRPTLEKQGTDKDTPIWVTADLQTGAGLVARRLRAEGYLQAEVKMEPAAALHDMKRDITVSIKAGPKFVYGDMVMAGAPPELERLMRAEVVSQRGQPFNEASVEQLQRKLTSIAYDRGYIQADTLADYKMGKAGGTVDVRLQVNAGVRVRITQVTPHPGFSRGATRVLNASFRDALGHYYSTEEKEFMYRRALDTGIFARLDDDLEMRPAVEGAAAELKLSGEETQPHTLGFELGYDTFLGAQVGVTYRNTNFYDTGNTVTAELNWSAGGPLGALQFINPAFFGSHYAATVRLAVENFNRYEYSRYGSSLNLELSRRVTKHFSFSGFVGASINTVSSGNLTPAQLGPLDYTIASAGLSAILDYRDSPVLPKKGWFLSGRLESSLDVAGSGISFMRTDVRGSWYQPITKKLRIAAGGAIQNIQGAAADELPIDIRVFNGGPNSVRSFAERELGPMTAGGTPLGGTSALFGSVELSYEIMQNFEFALFGDIGSLGRGNNSSPLSYSSDFRTAIGLGLRYHLPFGPIRIDYGHNLDQRPGESSGTLHVTVGFAF